MHSSAIPRKTELAKVVLQGRDFPGTRAQRSFLIMVDGRKPLRELAEAAEQLGVDDAAVTALVDAGLIEWVRRPSERAASAGSNGPQPSPTRATSGTAAQPRRAPVAPARAPRSMAATKMFVLDLATLMLQGQDGEVREAARE